MREQDGRTITIATYGRMLERCHIGPYISSVCLARSICREFGSDMASLPVVEQCLRTRGAR